MPKARLGACAGFGVGWRRSCSGCGQRGWNFDHFGGHFGGHFGERHLRHDGVHGLGRGGYLRLCNAFGRRLGDFGRFRLDFRLTRQCRRLECGAAIGAAQRSYPAGQCCIGHIIFGLTLGAGEMHDIGGNDIFACGVQHGGD
jgi:hypothetical protein